jgi:hypothetical protein
MYFDVPLERQSLRVVSCVYLYSQECTTRHGRGSDSFECGLGLALVPVKDTETIYKRVGHIQCLRLKYFQDAMILNIVLI